VTDCSGLEGRSSLRYQIDNLDCEEVRAVRSNLFGFTYLATPAEANDTPFFDVWILGLELAKDLVDLLNNFRWGGRGLEELAQLLALLVRVRWVPGDVSGLALEPVRHEDPVLVALVCVREDVGALERLREKAEDVEDVQNALGCRRGAGSVWTLIISNLEYGGEEFGSFA
jgi:hypothetical protein